MLLMILAGGILALALLLPRQPVIPPPAPGAASHRSAGASRPIPVLSRRYLERLAGLLLRSQTLDRWPLHRFVAAKLLLSLGSGLLVVLIWHKTRQPALLALLPLPLAAGWMLPDFAAKRRAAARQARIRRELPEILSGLAICLQTGLSLRSAIIELAQAYGAGPLGQELLGASSHMAAGASPPEALAALTERVGLPELTQAVGAIVEQAAQSAASAGAAAAQEAALAWERRRRQAEAIAQTASLQLFLPQLLFGFPALMLVLMGPVLLSFLSLLRAP